MDEVKKETKAVKETKGAKKIPPKEEGVSVKKTVAEKPSPQPPQKPKPKLQKKALPAKKKPKPSPSLRSYILFRLIFLLILCLMTFLAGYIMRTLAIKLQDKNTSLFILNEKRERMQTLETQFQTMAPDFAKIETSLPQEKELVEFVGFLDQLTAEASMSAFHFETEEPLLSPKKHPYLPFSLTLSAGFDALKNFLTQLTTGPYLIEAHFGEIKSTDSIFKNAELNIRAKLFVDPTFR